MKTNIPTQEKTPTHLKLTKKKNKIELFDIFNSLFLILLAMAMLFPVLHILAQSLSSEYAIVSGQVTIFPVGFNLDSYAYILQDWNLWRSLFVTIYVTVVGTFFALVMTILLAYPLSKPRLKARRWILLAIVFVMIFGTPVIPFFLTVRSTGLLDNLHSLIIPTAINAFNLLILKTFFENVHKDLEESARIDGCNDFQILTKIFIPVSKPAIATIALFYAVEKWNSYYHALMFINDRTLWPLQVFARNMFTVEEQINIIEGINREGIIAAVIIFAMVPILLVYPFLQKYFTKGVMLGSIKE